MSASFQLSPLVHAVPIEDDLVLLDIARDSYVCLPGSAEPWRELASAAVSPQSDALAQLLIAGGHGLAKGAGAPPVPPPLLPSSTLRPSGARVRPRDALHLLGAWLDLAAHYEGRSLAHIFRFARKPPAKAAGRVLDGELARLCEVFEHAVVWLPVSRKCLVRSFLLLRFLQRSGRDADWVIGVRVWPFAAHCWLQVGDAALDEDPDRARGYTPICAV